MILTTSRFIGDTHKTTIRAAGEALCHAQYYGMSTFEIARKLNICQFSDQSSVDRMIVGCFNLKSINNEECTHLRIPDWNAFPTLLWN